MAEEFEARVFVQTGFLFCKIICLVIPPLSLSQKRTTYEPTNKQSYRINSLFKSKLLYSYNSMVKVCEGPSRFGGVTGFFVISQ